LIKILKSKGAKFAAIDVKKKPEILEVLKTVDGFSGVPLLFIEGKVIGNADQIS